MLRGAAAATVAAIVLLAGNLFLAEAYEAYWTKHELERASTALLSVGQAVASGGNSKEACGTLGLDLAGCNLIADALPRSLSVLAKHPDLCDMVDQAKHHSPSPLLLKSTIATSSKAMRQLKTLLLRGPALIEGLQPFVAPLHDAVRGRPQRLAKRMLRQRGESSQDGRPRDAMVPEPLMNPPEQELSVPVLKKLQRAVPFLQRLLRKRPLATDSVDSDLGAAVDLAAYATIIALVEHPDAHIELGLKDTAKARRIFQNPRYSWFWDGMGINRNLALLDGVIQQMPMRMPMRIHRMVERVEDEARARREREAREQAILQLIRQMNDDLRSVSSILDWTFSKAVGRQSIERKIQKQMQDGHMDPDRVAAMLVGEMRESRERECSERALYQEILQHLQRMRIDPDRVAAMLVNGSREFREPTIRRIVQVGVSRDRFAVQVVRAMRAVRERESHERAIIQQIQLVRTDLDRVTGAMNVLHARPSSEIAIQRQLKLHFSQMRQDVLKFYSMFLCGTRESVRRAAGFGNSRSFVSSRQLNLVASVLLMFNIWAILQLSDYIVS